MDHQLATHVGSSDDDGDDVRRHRREICRRRQNIGDIDASVKVVGERLSDVESRIERVDEFVDETVSSLSTSLAVDDIGRSQVTSENLKVRKCVCFVLSFFPCIASNYSELKAVPTLLTVSRSEVASHLIKIKV